MKYLVLIFIAVITLSACSSLETDATYPKNMKDRRIQRMGNLSGDTGGLILFGKGKDEGGSASAGAGIGINSYLWRATLDVLSFMPLASADPFGGVIITDWYQDPNVPEERFKMNILILDQKLRSNALKVSVFKQIYIGNGRWQDSKAAPSVGRELEDKILTRARELRTADIPKQ